MVDVGAHLCERSCSILDEIILSTQRPDHQRSNCRQQTCLIESHIEAQSVPRAPQTLTHVTKDHASCRQSDRVLQQTWQNTLFPLTLVHFT